ncbi:MFS transporter [Candidatus Woesearchaeota archaeon]|nr:MFS transporter [Candidatus Woesearchaeota archaeon]
MRVLKHYYANFYKYFKSDLSKLEFSIWLYTIGVSLVSIFIPILLLSAGFPLKQVILFLIIFNATDVALNFLARKFVIWYGAKKTIIIAIIAHIGSFLLLYPTNYDWPLLVALAICLAIADSFYWVAHWFVFNECVHPRAGVGKQVGFLMVVRQTGGLVAPLVGAGFLIFLNKQYLVILSSLMLLTSLIPLSRIKMDHLKPKVVDGVFDFLKQTKNRINLLTIFFLGIDYTVEYTIIPIFVFITFLSFESVGIMPTIIAIVAMSTTIVIGKLADKWGKSKFIILGAFWIAIIWLLRIQNISELTRIFLYVTLVFAELGVLFIMVPLDARLVKDRHQKSLLDTSTYRNFGYMFAHAVTLTVLYFAANVFEMAFVLALLAITSLGILNWIFIDYNNKSNNGIKT